MAYSEPANFGETTERLQRLCDRGDKLRQSLRLPAEDARHIAVVDCSDIFRCAGISAHIIKSIEYGVLKSEDLERIAGIMPYQTKDAAARWIKNHRNSLILMYQFAIENMLRNISNAIRIKTGKKGFSEISKELLSKLGLSKYLLQISLLALIRNTLHNNGIHRGNHAEIALNGFEFRFRNGEAIKCSGWGHIILAIDGSLDVVEKILTHDDVVHLNAPILDLGAWDIFTSADISRPQTSE